jgi:chorismate synthase
MTSRLFFDNLFNILKTVLGRVKMLRHLTSGESHGRELTAIVEGLPSGLSLSAADIDAELARRQLGYGRGGRMLIEKDVVEITSGVRHGFTLGSPVGFVIRNRDWENWIDVMSVERHLPGQRRSRAPGPDTRTSPVA